MTGTIVIRPYRESDEAAIVELVRELQGHEQQLYDRMLPVEDIGPWYVQRIVQESANARGGVIVAEQVGPSGRLCLPVHRIELGGGLRRGSLHLRLCRRPGRFRFGPQARGRNPVASGVREASATGGSAVAPHQRHRGKFARASPLQGARIPKSVRESREVSRLMERFRRQRREVSPLRPRCGPVPLRKSKVNFRLYPRPGQPSEPPSDRLGQRAFAVALPAGLLAAWELRSLHPGPIDVLAPKASVLRVLGP